VSQADGANTLRPQETNTRLGSRIHSIIFLGERDQRWPSFRERKGRNANLAKVLLRSHPERSVKTFG